jgi:mono/diheme cytochrome c family protein
MKKILLFIAIFIAVFLISSISYIKFALPDAGPAPDIKVEMTSENVERGRYLANSVALCMDCHSTRDWTQYAGPPIPGTEGIGGERFDQNMGFPGVYYSRNITPYSLASWTDGEIFRAITTGISKDGSALFPVMPHPNYGQLDKKDIIAIIAYLRTLEPVETENIPSESDFPMSLIVNTIPKEASFVERPDPSEKVAYGKYILTMASCGDCHTKVKNGQFIEGMFLAGGREFITPWGTVRSANLTPDDKTGLGIWTEDSFLKRFKMHTDSTYVNPPFDPDKDMFTIMPWLMYANMKEEDLRAIYAYLRSLEPIEHSVTKWTRALAEN